MVSCAAGLYLCGQKRGRKCSFAHKGSRLLPDLKEESRHVYCPVCCRLKRERDCIKNGNEEKAWQYLQPVQQPEPSFADCIEFWLT